MKKKRNTWRSKLTKKEVKHMEDTAGCTTLAGLERNFTCQAQMRKDAPGMEPCWECRGIAQKLGFEV
jgi:succinate dehydrogenase/fumarate reductase flavoprotein subunit